MGNKYNAKKCEYNGEAFDSKKEMNRYIKLKELEEVGEISELKRQTRYELIPKMVTNSGQKFRSITYIADFEYTKNGNKIVEDVKGCRFGAGYRIFVIKKKLMYYIHKIEVIEV